MSLMLQTIFPGSGPCQRPGTIAVRVLFGKGSATRSASVIDPKPTDLTDRYRADNF
jgi:hypothetical protein